MIKAKFESIKRKSMQQFKPKKIPTCFNFSKFELERFKLRPFTVFYHLKNEFLLLISKFISSFALLSSNYHIIFLPFYIFHSCYSVHCILRVKYHLWWNFFSQNYSFNFYSWRIVRNQSHWCDIKNWEKDKNYFSPKIFSSFLQI